MRISITRGIYGFMESGHLVEKTSRSAPFEVDEEEGKRLIALHVARQASPDGFVDGTSASVENGETESEEAESPKDSEVQDELEDMSLEELRLMAKEIGVKKSGSREELIGRLRQCQASEEEEVLDEADMPELTAEEPE